MVSAVSVQTHSFSAGMPAEKPKAPSLGTITRDLFTYIASFCNLRTFEFVSKALRISDQEGLKILERRVGSKGSISWDEIAEWERLRGRRLTSFQPDDHHIAFAKNIQHLRVDFRDLSSGRLIAYLQRFPNLTSIEFVDMDLSYNLITFINRFYPNLEKLSLRHCYPTNPAIPAGYLVHNLHKLRSFTLTSYPITTGECERITSSCPLLTDLTLKSVGLTNSGLGALSRLKETLTSLDIGFNSNVTLDGIAFVLGSFTKLQKLDIEESNNGVAEAAIRQSFCDDLEELVGVRPDDRTLKAIADHFPNLRRCAISEKNSEEAVFYLLDHCDHLETIDFGNFLFSEKGYERFLEYIKYRPSLAPENIESLKQMDDLVQEVE